MWYKQYNPFPSRRLHLSSYRYVQQEEKKKEKLEKKDKISNEFNDKKKEQEAMTPFSNLKLYIKSLQTVMGSCEVEAGY